MKRVIDFTYKFFFNFREFLDEIQNDSSVLPTLGVVGIIVSYFSSFLYSERIDVALLSPLLGIIVYFTFITFLIGIVILMGKKSVIETSNLLWFFFSLGLIDILWIVLWGLIAFVNLKFFIFLVTFTWKLVYATIGLSRFINTSKGTALLIILSPTVIIGIILIIVLAIGYYSLQGIDLLRI